MRALGAVVAALTIAGCGTAARRVVRDAPVTGPQISCSFAVDYNSLAPLRRDAVSVAVVSPTGAVRTRVVSGLPMKDATVRVVELVAGRRLPSSFTLFDVADSRVEGSENCSPTISKGNAYLVYLTPFRLRRKGPPGAGRFWVVGGPQGNYIHTGTPPPSDPSERSFIHQMSDVGTSLPQRISVAEARSS
jgi:hypothetical protein